MKPELYRFRVLVVEDHAPFRAFLASLLRPRADLQIVWEETDGMGAVEKAKELRPDLILLDIGLPKLNGIEAALQIREISPQSKILFVSGECSADIVQAALRAGGCGYVVKNDASGELLVALDAVLRGEWFVGSRFSHLALDAIER